MRQRAMMDMEMAELGAAMQLRERLAGIEQPVRVEGAFDAKLLVEIACAEHRRHEIALLDADAVLARENTADLDAIAHDVVAAGFGGFDLARLRGVVKNQ